jgi:hypothetical protein
MRTSHAVLTRDTGTLNIRVDKIKENVVGGTYGTHGRGQEHVQGFGGKTRMKETTWETKV